MMIRAIVFLAVNFFVSFLFAEIPIIDKANKLYTNQQFDKAIILYEQLVQKECKTAAFHFNLGNAYYKSGQIARSIASLERAKRLSPKDEDILHNLQFVKSKTKDKINKEGYTSPSELIQRWLSFLSALEWRIIAIFLFWLCAILLSLAVFLKKYKSKLISIAISGLSIGLFSFWASKLQFSVENNCDSAVVLATKVFVKSAPNSTSDDLFVLHEGAELKVLDRVNNYQKVRLVDGKTGWVPKNQLIII
jgi:tetratricopeptide (TPR) repeat protein